MTRIGLLLPNSNFINRLATDIRHWVEFGLNSASLPKFELVIETTLYNESADELRAKIQTLLVKENVDVIVAPLNPGMIEKVGDLVRGQQIPLIALSMGEDVVKYEISLPWVFHISFNLWRSAWLSGKYAVETFGPKACSIMALHEGGYALPFAFGLGVEASGGADGGAFPLQIDATKEHVREKFEWVEEMQSDFVLLLGTNEDKDLMTSVYSESAIKIPAVGLAPQGYFPGISLPGGASPIKTVISSWDPTSKDAKSFIDRFAKASGEPAHAFAVMANEAGGLLAHALKLRGSKKGGKALASALLDAKFTGPRGEVFFDSDSQETVLPQHLLNFSAPYDGTVLVTRNCDVEIPDLLLEHIALARKNMGKTGWLNPYLIA